MVKYFDLDRTKQYLEISDTDDDSLLRDFALSAEQDMDNFLRSITEDLPTGDAITDVMKDVVNYRTAAKYLASKKDFDGANYWSDAAKDLKDTIRIGMEEQVDEEVLVLRRR